MANKLAELRDRVCQFCCLELPGQPQQLHMGTFYLVRDLAAALNEMEGALRSCTAALNESAPVHDDYWAAVERAEKLIAPDA